MLRLLLQAGLGFATFDVGRRIARLKRLAVFVAVAAVIGLLGLGALTAALIVWLTPQLGAAGAAAAVGAGLLVVAGLVVWIGTWKPARRSTATPVVERVRSEVAAAGAALSASRAERAERADRPPRPSRPGDRRKRAINMTLIAVLAGIVLGRRL